MSHILFHVQDGDVIELCQVSDIRAGGLPKVRMSSPLSNGNVMRQKKKRNYSISEFLKIYLSSATACNNRCTSGANVCVSFQGFASVLIF